MRKLIIVTKNASSTILNKYKDCDMVGLDEGIFIVKRERANLIYAISSFKNVDLNQVLTFVNKNKVMKYDTSTSPYLLLNKVVTFLINKGYEDIVILDSFNNNLNHIQSLLLVLKISSGHISFHDENNLITYYKEGNHIITKQGYNSFSLIGFPFCIVSMEHVLNKVEHLSLSFDNNLPFVNKLFDRLASLKVEKGGVLLVQFNDD